MPQTVKSVLTLKQDGDRLISVEAGASVREAIDTLVGHGIGAVLIMNEDGLVDGIFTERDVLRRVAHPRIDPEATPVSMVMTRNVRFVTPGTSVEAALALMHVNRFRHLLVMDGPQVHGLVSIGDMTNHLIRHGEGRFEAEVRGAAAAMDPEPAAGAASQEGA